MLEIQNSISEMKSFSGLISRLDTAEQRISKLEDMPINLYISYLNSKRKKE